MTARATPAPAGDDAARAMAPPGSSAGVEAMMGAGTVVLTRGGLEESWHRFEAVVASADGGRVVVFGDERLPVFARSAIKPLQASAVVDSGAVEAAGLGTEEVALACASHGGEPEHVAIVRRTLERLSVAEEDLACGAHAPLYAPAADALLACGERPGKAHNNCSGKHAAMVALARHLGAPVAGYHEPDHPVQRRMAEEVGRWSGLDPDRLERAVDGCGVVTFRLPLGALADAFARWGVAAGAPETVRAAAAAHPWLLAGTGRLCTAIVRETEGAVLAKVGAEGVYCACVPGRGLGLAVKALDGARRAGDAALVALLRRLGVVDDDVGARLAAVGGPPRRNTRGEVVGGVDVRLPGPSRA